MDNVTIIGGGSNTAARFGGAHTAAELLALAAVATDDVDLGAMDVLVDNVMLAGGEHGYLYVYKRNGAGYDRCR